MHAFAHIFHTQYAAYARMCPRMILWWAANSTECTRYWVSQSVSRLVGPLWPPIVLRYNVALYRPTGFAPLQLMCVVELGSREGKEWCY